MISFCILIIIFVTISLLSTQFNTVHNAVGKQEGILTPMYTTCLRGIAIILIMICHVSGTLGTVIATPFGGIGVAIFLFVSGYGLNESYKTKGLKNFWKKKIFRVFIPYLIVETIRLIFSGGGKDPLMFILDVTGIQSDYWYISFLFRCYLVFYISTKFATKFRMYLLLLFSIYLLFFTPNIQAEQAFSFIAGILISNKIEFIRTLPKVKFSVFSITAFVIGCTFLVIKQLPDVRLHLGDWIYGLVECGIKLPYALCIISGLYIIPVLMQSRFLLFAGNISYELYLVHFPFYTKVGGNILYILVFFTLSFLIAFLFYKINNWISAKCYR